MQLVPLSTDGRVVAIASTRLEPGSFHAAVEPDAAGVRVVALGPGAPRPVGRFTAVDATAYGPVLRRLWERGLVGSCPARVTPGGAVLLALAPASRCVPAGAPARPSPPAPLRQPGATRGRRRVMWAGAAVVGVLALAGVVGNGGRADTPRATTVAADVTPSVTTETTTTETTTTAVPTGTSRVEPPVVVLERRTTPRTTTPRRTTTHPAPAPPPTTTRTSSPTSRTSAPRTRTAPTPEAGSGCDPNYSGCVPIASDVDCEGGSGNGPAYVRGPVRVTGKDVYGLDADHDGLACE